MDDPTPEPLLVTADCPDRLPNRGHDFAAGLCDCGADRDQIEVGE